MAEAISGVLQKQMDGSVGGGAEKMAQNAQQNGRSFESVMQEGNSQNTDSINQFGKLNDPKMEQLRVDLLNQKQMQVPAAKRQDLINRANNVPPGQPNVTAILPEVLDTKSGLNNFSQILARAAEQTGGIAKNSGITGIFQGIENQYASTMTAFNSAQNMSQGQLLVMQARLYQVSQHVDVLSKVVDQMTGGVKTVLNTNI